MLRHPSDGEAWKHFDWVHADFAIDPRNVRLSLCTDGFDPYIQASSSPYSCWPIIVTLYNLPLERDEPPRMLTPTQVWHRVRDLPKVTKTSLPPPNISCVL